MDPSPSWRGTDSTLRLDASAPPNKSSDRRVRSIEDHATTSPRYRGGPRATNRAVPLEGTDQSPAPHLDTLHRGQRHRRRMISLPVTGATFTEHTGIGSVPPRLGPSQAGLPPQPLCTLLDVVHLSNTARARLTHRRPSGRGSTRRSGRRAGPAGRPAKNARASAWKPLREYPFGANTNPPCTLQGWTKRSPRGGKTRELSDESSGSDHSLHDSSTIHRGFQTSRRSHKDRSRVRRPRPPEPETLPGGQGQRRQGVGRDGPRRRTKRLLTSEHPAQVNQAGSVPNPPESPPTLSYHFCSRQPRRPDGKGHIPAR